MKLRHNDIDILDDGKTDPFINCKLERKKYAEVLTSIVDSYADGFVLAINNPWGTGKTTFIKMWKQQLKNNEYKTLYFNAWENDYQSEVIIALLSELDELKEKAKDAFDNVLSKTAVFLKKVAPAVLKGAASKALGNDAVSDIVEAFTEYTTEELEKEISDLNKSKQAIIDFKESLQKFVEKVDNDKPIIFIIDELDRCRPNYAVEILEQIKHLFSVPGIVFVLSIDKEQLGHAIRGVYNSEKINANEYLRRFIDLEYSIPEPNNQQFIEYLYKYYDFDSFINSEARRAYESFKEGKDKDNLLIIAQQLFSTRGFKLRQIEKIFARIRVIVRSFRENQFLFPEIIVLISFLEEEHGSVLEDIKNRKYSLQQLSDKMDKILYPIIDGPSTRRITFLVASFMNLYENYYRTPYRKSTDVLINYEDANNIRLGITSKFNDDEMLLYKAIDFYKNQMYTDDLGLDFILNKYNLTENIVS